MDLNPLQITFFFVSLTLLWYLYSGISEVFKFLRKVAHPGDWNNASSWDYFFLGNRRLPYSTVRNTFSAATISISTTLLFFLTLSVLFGWWVFLSPVALYLGIRFFNWVVSKINKNEHLERALRETINSLPELVYQFYQSTSIKWAVTIISVLGVMAILIAEIMVGVTIFGDYFVNPDFIGVIIGFILLVYCGFGGITSVVKTDKFQIKLIGLCLFVFTISLWVPFFWTSDSAPVGVSEKLSLAPRINMPLALIVNIFIVNICLIPSSLRTWQILASVSDGTSGITGFKKPLREAIGIISVIVVCSVAISIFFGQRTDGQLEITDIFRYLSEEGGLISYFLYPCFTAAMLAAIISTADSMLLPVMQQFSKRPKNNLGNSAGENFLARLKIFGIPRLKIFGILCVLLIFVGIFYIVVVKEFEFSIVPWVLTVFSITTTIAPVILAPIFFKPKEYSSLGKFIICSGLGLGLFLSFYWSVIYKGQIDMQPWNCLIGFLITLIATGAVIFFSPDKTNKE